MTPFKTSVDTSKLSDIKVNYIEKYLQGSKILDAGAGYCYYSEWLVQTHPGLEVTSLDQLDLAGNGYRFMQADFESPISLDSEQFQTILAFDIVEHIANEHLFVKELFRLCQSGGVLIGSVPHDDDNFLPAYNLTFKHRRDVTHKRYYLPETITRVLSDAGFTVCMVQKQGSVSPHVIAEFFPLPTRFILKKIISALRYVHIISSARLSTDLFFVAYKR